MSDSAQPIEVEPILLKDLAGALPANAHLRSDSLRCDRRCRACRARNRQSRRHVSSKPGEPWRFYWLVLEGEIRAERPEPDGTWTSGGHRACRRGIRRGALAHRQSQPRCSASPRRRIRCSSASPNRIFGRLLACCPAVRKTILADSAQRLQAYQVEALHREKLVSLGTLAAGLMHELHNPGSAAKRAASQLRENLLRLQQLSLRNSGKPKTPAQLECMRNLLEHALQRLQPTRDEHYRAGRRRGGHERVARQARESRTPSPSALCSCPWASIARKSPAPRSTSIPRLSPMRSTGSARSSPASRWFAPSKRASRASPSW